MGTALVILGYRFEITRGKRFPFLVLVNGPLISIATNANGLLAVNRRR